MGIARRVTSHGLLVGWVALCVSAAGQTTEGWRHFDDWPQFQFGSAHQGRNPYEFQLNRWNVAHLHLLWRGNTHLASRGGVSVAGGRVFAQSEDGHLYAFPTDCASDGSHCQPLWISQPPQYGTGSQWDVPAVAEGIVYFYSDRLYAYETDCASDGSTCAPLWTAWLGNAFYDTSPVVKDGIVYVAGNRLYAFDAHCNTGGGSCAPLWQSANDTYPAGMGSPAIQGDEIYVLSPSGDFYAYPLHCPAAECSPSWRAKTDVGALLYGPRVSVSAANGRVFVPGLNGWLYAFPAHCASGGNLCTPLWTAQLSNYGFSTPAVWGETVYTGSYDGRLYAFPTDCSPNCTPRWIGRTPSSIYMSSPALANGVVYIAAWSGLVAFPARCGQDGAHCEPLWVGDGGSFSESSPAISRGVVYVGSYDGNVRAFGLGPPP